jgi:hypothetical protein
LFSIDPSVYASRYAILRKRNEARLSGLANVEHSSEGG